MRDDWPITFLAITTRPSSHRAGSFVRSASRGGMSVDDSTIHAATRSGLGFATVTFRLAP